MKLKRKFRQLLVLWDNPVADGYGHYTYDSETEHSCRWEDKQELFKDEAGKEVVSQAVVYTDFVPTKGQDGWGYVFRGGLADLPSDTSRPESIEGAFRIRHVGRMPSRRASQELVKIML